MSQPSDNAQIILPLINNCIYDYCLFFLVNLIENQILFQNQNPVSLSFQDGIPWFRSDIWIVSKRQNGCFKSIQFVQCGFFSELLSNIQNDVPDQGIRCVCT